MRVVVLDTNVIISARAKPTGKPGQLLHRWIFTGLVQIVTSPTIVREYREVASRRKFARYGFPPPWLDVLIAEGLQLPDELSWPHDLPDRDDVPFVALAHRAGAWLVTGNLKHYPASTCAGITVVSPADYLAHLESGTKMQR